MENDSSIFLSLSGALEENIYFIGDYTLTFTGNGDDECQHDRISDVYHVPILSENQVSVAKLAKTKKVVEFQSDHFIVKDMTLCMKIVASGILDPKDRLYKLCDPPLNVSQMTGMTTLIAQMDDKIRIWHERIGHLTC